jgi:murein DD-endopeptidase MepM/ murein hydrolase activator NlpD
MIRTAAFGALVAAVLAAFAAGARADTFAVVPDQQPLASAPLPSAGVPNAAGSIVMPPDLSTPPSTHSQLSLADLESLWQRAGAAYGISWQVLGAINKIESNFGQNMGPSSAGAVGWMQFMPSTWERWGVDANGDGVADPWNPDDAVFAAARYLAAAGGATDIRSAIFSYNHATWYVDDVLQMAGLIGSGDTAATPVLDQLGERVARLRDRVEQLERRIAAARTKADSLDATVTRLLRHAASRRLLSDKLDIRMHAAHVELRRSQATADVERLRTLLDQAQADLRTPQALPASSFAGGLGTSIAAPAAPGSLVYPLGQTGQLIGFPYQGTHLLYGNWESDNAVDISAPIGTPVYAVAAGTIGSQIGSLGSGDPRLQGERLHLVTATDEFYYAHLSVIVVRAGQTVQAGQLLGYSGAANGVAHLHFAERDTADAERTGTAGGTHWYDYIAAAGSSSPLDTSAASQPVAFGAPSPTARVFAVVPTS